MQLVFDEDVRIEMRQIGDKGDMIDQWG